MLSSFLALCLMTLSAIVLPADSTGPLDTNEEAMVVFTWNATSGIEIFRFYNAYNLTNTSVTFHGFGFQIYMEGMGPNYLTNDDGLCLRYFFSPSCYYRETFLTCSWFDSCTWFSRPTEEYRLDFNLERLPFLRGSATVPPGLPDQGADHTKSFIYAACVSGFVLCVLILLVVVRTRKAVLILRSAPVAVIKQEQRHPDLYPHENYFLPVLLYLSKRNNDLRSGLSETEQLLEEAESQQQQGQQFTS